MRYFNPEVALQVQVPDYNKVFDSIQEGMQLGNQIKEQRQQGILSRLIAQNTKDGQVDLNSALQSVQSNPNQAYQPALINTLTGMIKQQNAEQLKAQQEALKSDAELNKTYAETGKIKNEGVGKGLENSEKKFGALNQIFQAAALSGSKNNILLGLNGALKSGLIDQDMFNQQQQIIQLMTPEEIRSYASNITLGNSKDPASYLFQTANNAADNKVSEANNIRTNQTTQRGQTLDFNLGKDKLAQDQKQFNQSYALDAQKAFFEQNKPIGFEVGNDGYKYAIYPNGKGVRVLGDDGQPIKVQQKSGNLTAQNAQREETQRLQRVDAILPEIEKILPNATSSYLGSGLDMGGRLFGYATDGAKATAQLKTLAGQLVSLMPKMSGPQSDKDVAMYREMAGNLADDTQPIQTRMAALQTIKELNNKYKGMNQQSGASTPQSTFNLFD